MDTPETPQFDSADAPLTEAEIANGEGALNDDERVREAQERDEATEAGDR